MCGRFSVSVDPFLVAERFQVAVPDDARPRYNVAPTQPVLVVRRSRERGVVADEVRWGLVPHWAKDTSGSGRMINARVETLQAKFGNLLERRRCLVPSDGFYEWRTDPDGKRRPVRYTLADGSLFAFAGLWAVWKDPQTGELLRSCTIVTCPPNDIVEPVHDRMPVILPWAAEARWLSEDVGAAEAMQLLLPFPAEEMAVGRGVAAGRQPRQRHRRAVRPVLRGRAAARRAAGVALDEQHRRAAAVGEVAQRRRGRPVAALDDHELGSHAREERVDLLRAGMGDVDPLDLEAQLAGRGGELLGGLPRGLAAGGVDLPLVRPPAVAAPEQAAAGEPQLVRRQGSCSPTTISAPAGRSRRSAAATRSGSRRTSTSTVMTAPRVPRARPPCRPAR